MEAEVTINIKEGVLEEEGKKSSDNWKYSSITRHVLCISSEIISIVCIQYLELGQIRIQDLET